MSKSQKEQGMFDFVVSKNDKKGKNVSYNPYRMVVENGMRKMERPPGSGYWYDESNNLLSQPKVEEKTKEQTKGK